ncbi:unnamed protein product, partial [Didymodactylos carnosus]
MHPSSNASLINSSSSELCPTGSHVNCALRYEMMAYISRVNYYMLIINSIIALGGILGNILALIVINRKPLKNTSSSVFITYLALFDISVLAVHMFTLFMGHFRLRNLLLYCVIIFTTDLVTFCGIWILVIITLGKRTFDNA